MQEASTSEELAAAFYKHTSDTQLHIENLERIFDLLDEESDSKKCKAMEGLIEEAESIISDTEKTAIPEMPH